MAELDEVLALEWDAAPPASAGGLATARGHLGEEWLIGHAINGGVLMALGLGAAAEGLTASGHTAPLSWSAHFLSAAVATVVRQLLTIDYAIEGLPDGLVLRDVVVRADGFRATLQGSDVALVP